MSTSSNLLRLYFVTWNVATKYPEQNVLQLLGLGSKKKKSLADIYIVGLQEVKAKPQNIVLDIFLEDPWTKSFREALKEYDYVRVRTQRLQGILLNVFCLRKHLPHLRSIEAGYTKCGFKGMWGNKGVVSVRMDLYGVNMCIVNAHLQAHDHLLADRINDCNIILREHSFDTSHTSQILFHDYVFWIGDLNFRIADGLSASDIDLLIKNDQLDVLLAKDQLTIAKQKGEALAEFMEEKITFPPTYKFEFASQNYDLRRRPSWTDRILYLVNANVYPDVQLRIVQYSYKSHSNYVQSDHKPVTGEVEIVIRPEIADDGIEFLPMTEWYLEEENTVSYKMLGNSKPAGGDWIGLYPQDFSSLDEYLLYEYIGRGVEDPVEQTVTERIFLNNLTVGNYGMYRMVYVAQQGNIIGILGVSEPFVVRRRAET